MKKTLKLCSFCFAISLSLAACGSSSSKPTAETSAVATSPELDQNTSTLNTDAPSPPEPITTSAPLDSEGMLLSNTPDQFISGCNAVWKNIFKDSDVSPDDYHIINQPNSDGLYPMSGVTTKIQFSLDESGKIKQVAFTDTLENFLNAQDVFGNAITVLPFASQDNIDDVRAALTGIVDLFEALSDPDNYINQSPITFDQSFQVNNLEYCMQVSNENIYFFVARPDNIVHLSAEASSRNNNETSSHSEVYSAGTYLVGDDIPAGEYYLECDSSWGAYYAICEDSSGELSGILANSNFSSHAYVNLREGRYFDLDRATAIPVENAPSFEPDEEGYYSEGQYRIGIDIPAGEYKAIVSEDNRGGYWARLEGANEVLSNIIANDNFEGSTYIKVKDGEYLRLTACKIKLK